MDRNTPQLSTGAAAIQHHGYTSGLQNRTLWALILDKREAHIFEMEGRRFNRVKAMENLQLVYNGLDDDTIGRGRTMGGGRHKYDPTMQESRQNTIAFAKEIVAWLDKGRRSGRFDELVIAASPTMLGEVLKDMGGTPLEKCVVDTVSKNMMEFNGKELEQELLKLIPGPTKV